MVREIRGAKINPKSSFKNWGGGGGRKIRGGGNYASKYGILSSVASQTPPYFSTLPHKWHDFRKNTEIDTCVLILSTTFVSNISRSNKNKAKYYHKPT